MSFTVFLGNLPAWVTADDIEAWLTAENLVSDSIKVIRNPETQESKGFAFIEAPNQEEMASIIKRFDRAPLEDRLLRANPAQPPRGRVAGPGGPPPAAAGERPAFDRGAPRGDRRMGTQRRPPQGGPPAGAAGAQPTGNQAGGKQGKSGGTSAFAEELAKAL